MIPRIIKNLRPSFPSYSIRSTQSISHYTPISLEQVIHDIQITGNLVSVHRLSNGSVRVFIRSILGKNNIVTHRAYVMATSPMVDLFKNDKNIGRQISITGKLKTQPLENVRSDVFGKSFRKVAINISTAYFCQTTNNACTNNAAETSEEQYWVVDDNRVDVIGYIESNIVKGSDFRAFTLFVKPSRRHEESKTLRYLYNRVLVYDERLFPLLDQETDTRQLLYISGELSYELPTNDLCYTVDSGSYIIAHRLHCIRTDVLNLL